MARKKHIKPRPPPAFLAQFAAALAVIETATAAIEAVEDRGHLAIIGSEIATLRQGVQALQRVYSEVDLLFLAGAS